MRSSENAKAVGRIEWPTIGLISGSYASWTLLLFAADTIHPVVWILLSAINITLFMSITHEVVHAHPTRNERLNFLLILLPIAWSTPVERFRDTHLQHHETGTLTDPFDDPESWYVDPAKWHRLGRANRKLLEFNNTLLGRMILGPAIGFAKYYASEIVAILTEKNNRQYLLQVWGKHLLLCGFLGWTLWLFGIPFWQVAISIYLGHSLLYVRTFLEHQAAEDRIERTVIIDKPCPLAFLFLYNNYHFIHHEKPGIPWYRLPGIYRQNRERWQASNNSYCYDSYREIFCRYFLTMKEPVLWPLSKKEI